MTRQTLEKHIDNGKDVWFKRGSVWKSGKVVGVYDLDDVVMTDVELWDGVILTVSIDILQARKGA